MEPATRKRARAEPRPRDTSPATHSERDEHASPLGRGVDPGQAESTFPLSDTKGSIAGARGHEAQNALGGPSGHLQRANEDAAPSARRGRYPSHDPSGP